MKTVLFSRVGHLLMAVLFLGFSACSEEDTANPNPNEEPEVAWPELMAGTWTNSEASLDGTDVSEDFASFTLSIDESLSFTSNADELNRQPNPWITQGMFTLDESASSSSQFRLLRNDGLTIDGQLDEDDKTLVLSFTYDESALVNGRTQAVGGDWSFTLTK